MTFASFFSFRFSIIYTVFICLLSLYIQYHCSFFILFLPIVFIITYCNKYYAYPPLYNLHTSLFFSFLTVFSYEYSIHNHTHSLQALSHIHDIQLYITDKEIITNNAQYGFKLTGTITHNNPLLSHKKIYLYFPKQCPYLPGDCITIKNCHFSPTQKADFSLFLLKENALHSLFITKKQHITLIYRSPHSMQYLLWEKRSSMIDLLQKECSKECFDLAACLFWGNKNNIKQNFETKELFRAMGITHYLARSGLHMAIFAMVWIYLSKLLFLPFRKRTLLLIIIAFLYNLLSWSSISFIRALWTFICICLANLYKTRIHTLHILGVLCLYFLITNPIQILFLDFQLSFGLTCALVWYSSQKNLLNLNTNINY